MVKEEIQLPELETPYALSAEQREEYRKNGHIRLDGVASREEADTCRASIRDVVVRMTVEEGPFREREKFYSQAFLQQMNLWVRSEAARRFTLAKRFARIAAELMGVDGVRIYHDHAVFKIPGGRHTPWHQDRYYWPLGENCPMLTMWMPLVDLSPDMGAMRFASGSHRLGSLGAFPISDESEQVFEDYIETHGLPVVETGDMKAGDATFHDSWTLHGALANRSERMREVMTVIYMADNCRVARAVNDYQLDDLSRWLPGAKPGDLAATRLNPLAYSEVHRQSWGWSHPA